MSKSATLNVDGRAYPLPIVEGTEGERALDISQLRAQSGLITLDYGFANTGSCESAITFVDGEKGILRYRGYPIEELCAHSSFLEVCYLLIYGELPTAEELESFQEGVMRNTLLHEDLKPIFDAFPRHAHPTALLSSVVCCLSTFHQDCLDPNNDEHVRQSILLLLGKLPTIAAYLYKKSIGQPLVYPNYNMGYTENFLNMMFSVPCEPYEVDPEVAHALDQLFILHADHEQNCSTSTVRMAGSSWANLFVSISTGICALWGPLHGGANQRVVEMLQRIYEDGGNVKKYVELAKDKTSGFRLMGFGHRVYKNFDPRARIIKKSCDIVLAKLGVHDPLLEIAHKLEETALKDEYFIERKLYPNVDFYSGILYRAMGFPTNMFPVLFALGRLPGWIAHWVEMMADARTRLGRPRQIYVGANERRYVPLDRRLGAPTETETEMDMDTDTAPELVK